MTCIAAIAHEGQVFMGADSAAVGGVSLIVRADPKVFRVGEFVIGYTTSFRMGQILRFCFQPPPIQGDLDKYMVVAFVDAVRAAFRAAGYLQVVNGVESGGDFLVGVRGCIFEIGNDYQVGRPLLPYDAVGSGSKVAFGSLATTHGMPLDPRRRLGLALTAAELHCTGVRGPFVYAETTRADAGRADVRPPDPVQPAAENAESISAGLGTGAPYNPSMEGT